MDNLRNLLDTNSTKRVGPAMRLPFQLCSCIKSQAGILRSRCVIVVTTGAGCASPAETAGGQRCLKNTRCPNLFKQMTALQHFANVLQPNYNLHCLRSNKRKRIDSTRMKRAFLKKSVDFEAQFAP